MFELVREVSRVFSVLRRWRGVVQRDDRVRGTARGVMELVMTGSPKTVSDMARTRGASRQQVQQQVDRLLDLGFVERAPNPAHKTAPLIEPTDRGRAVVETIRSAEHVAFSRLQLGVSDEAIADAVRVLQALHEALERDLQARKADRL